MAALNQFTYTLPGTIEAGFVTVFKTADFRSEMLDGGVNGFTAECGNGQAYTDDTLATRIPIDVVRCVVGGAPDVEIHVRHPTGGTGATIHWVADSVQTVQPAATALYGSQAVWSNYLAVLLLNDGTYADRTGNGYDGIVNSAPTQSTVGHPSGGTWTSFDGVDDWIDLTGSGDILDSAAEGSVSCWSRSNGEKIGGIVSNRRSSQAGDFFQITNDTGGSGRDILVVHDGTGETNHLQDANYNVARRLAISWDSAGLIGHFNDVHTIAESFPGDGQFVSNNLVTIGNYYEYSGTFSFSGYIGDVRIADAKLSDDWQQAEYDNALAVTAWGTVGPLIPAGGAGATVDVPVGSIALTGYAPSVQSSYSVIIPAASISLTGYAPTVSTGAGLDIEIPSGSIALTGYIPVIGIGATASPSLGSITLSGYAPDVVVGGGVSVTPGTAAIGLTGYAPEVVIGAGVSVEPLTASVALTGYIPTVEAGTAQSITVPLGILTLTGYVPTFFTGVVLLPPSNRTLVVSAESRVELIGAESRISTIPAESRVLTIEV